MPKVGMIERQIMKVASLVLSTAANLPRGSRYDQALNSYRGVQRSQAAIYPLSYPLAGCEYDLSVFRSPCDHPRRHTEGDLGSARVSVWGQMRD